MGHGKWWYELLRQPKPVTPAVGADSAIHNVQAQIIVLEVSLFTPPANSPWGSRNPFPSQVATTRES
jgi:hypothetical protein